jgi:hypothetical protein
MGMMSGIRQTIINPLKPAKINWYIASKKRRKSIATLPPLSWAYVV